MQVPCPTIAECPDELLVAKLGTAGRDRYCLFRDTFSAGWGEHGRGCELKPASAASFIRFLTAMPPPQYRPPTLFLTDDGHLELIWRDVAGYSVQIEFADSMVEFYLESTGQEGVWPADSSERLSELLPAP